MERTANVPEIIWYGCKPEQIALNLKIGGKIYRRGTPEHRDIVADVQELPRLLFPDAQSLLIKLIPPGHSGTVVLRVQASYLGRGVGVPIVVKMGDVHVIEQEYSNYASFVQNFLRHSTAIINWKYTDHLGAVVYTLLETTVESLEDFGTFYRVSSLDQIKKCLDYLFQITCGIWYANAGTLRHLNLTEVYRKQLTCTPQRMERLLSKNLPSVLGIDQKFLTFSSLKTASSSDYINPLYMVKKTTPDFACTTYETCTHGDFNQRNIMVDKSGHTWLLDFQETGPAHILRDFVTLDAEIRFQLLSTQEASLDERLSMEKTLCSCRHFNQLRYLENKLSSENSAVVKAFEAVLHLRILAAKMIERNPMAEISEYKAALFYSTLNSLYFSSLEDEQRAHVLLSASLLAEQLWPNYK